MEEFEEAMKKIMGDVEDEDLHVMFMKVDTNCDGTVDWIHSCHQHVLLMPSYANHGNTQSILRELGEQSDEGLTVKRNASGLRQ
ncbi:hypothetical protein SRHO_G00152660 [Serrasalmus rhombeus]